MTNSVQVSLVFEIKYGECANYLLSMKSNNDFTLDFRMKAAPRIFIKLIGISGEDLFRALIRLNKNYMMGMGI